MIVCLECFLPVLAFFMANEILVSVNIESVVSIYKNRNSRFTRPKFFELNQIFSVEVVKNDFLGIGNNHLCSNPEHCVVVFFPPISNGQSS